MSLPPASRIDILAEVNPTRSKSNVIMFNVRLDADAEEEKEEDENDDIREELSEREAELRQYLLHNEPLSEETIIELASQFWHQEPFRYVCSWGYKIARTVAVFLSPCCIRSH